MEEKAEPMIKGTAEVDLFAKLRELRDEGSLCDIELIVGNEKVKAHKCVLASMSPYFRAMFTNDFRESQEGVVDMSKTFDTCEPLKYAVEFMYGCEITVTETNVKDYLKCASLFQISDLSLICFNFLINTLTVRNCLFHWMTAKVYDIKPLEDVCTKLALSTFSGILINLDETLEVPPYFMKQFLKSGLAFQCTDPALKEFLHKYSAKYATEEELFKDIQKMLSGASEEDSGHAGTFNTPMDQMVPLGSGIADQSKIIDIVDPEIGFRESDDEVERQEPDTGIRVENGCKKLLVWNLEAKEFVLYSIPDSKWFLYDVSKVVKKDLMFSNGLKLVGFSCIYPEEPVAFLINELGDRSLSETDKNYNCFMVGMKSKKVDEVPKIRLLAVDKEVREDFVDFSEEDYKFGIETVQFFCASGALYAVSLVKLMVPGEEEDDEFDDCFRVQMVIDKLDIATMTWDRACSFDEKIEPGVVRCGIAQMDAYGCHIIMLTSYELGVIHYDSLDLDEDPVEIITPLPDEIMGHDSFYFDVRSFDGKFIVQVDAFQFHFQVTKGKWRKDIGYNEEEYLQTPKESVLGFLGQTLPCEYADPAGKYFMVKKFMNLHHLIKIDNDNKITTISPALFTPNDPFGFHWNSIYRAHIAYANMEILPHFGESDYGEGYLDQPVLSFYDKEGIFDNYAAILEQHGGSLRKKYCTGIYQKEHKNENDWSDFDQSLDLSC